MDILLLYCALQNAIGLERMINSDEYTLRIIKDSAYLHVQELEHIYNRIKEGLPE